MIEFYDTHAHLDYPEFQPDMEPILLRARAAGITRIICIGTDGESSRRAIALTERYEMVFAVVGWHPNDAIQAPEDVRPLLRELVKHPKVVALGETGLDYYRLPGTKGGASAEDEPIKRRQADLFRQHLEVAAGTGLNCVIHQRGDCFDDTLSILRPFAACVRGQFHCFSGTVSEMRQLLDINSIVSFTGIATFKNAQSIRDTVAATPIDRFMLETDCPYLAPVPHRGKRCEPAFVRETATVIAETKGCSLDELSAATCRTAREFFKKLR